MTKANGKLLHAALKKNTEEEKEEIQEETANQSDANEASVDVAAAAVSSELDAIFTLTEEEKNPAGFSAFSAHCSSPLGSDIHYVSSHYGGVATWIIWL